MARILIDDTLRRMEAAYRLDPFHAIRKNIESVRPDEWGVRPTTWSKDEFGDRPELSVCDLALHVGGAKYMYADRAFGEAKLEWHDIALPQALDMATVLAWMDEGYRLLKDGIAALEDDAQLAEQRQAPWRTPMTRAQLVALTINHDLYHSGEINRQRALMRGAEGWER